MFINVAVTAILPGGRRNSRHRGQEPAVENHPSNNILTLPVDSGDLRRRLAHIPRPVIHFARHERNQFIQSYPTVMFL